MADGLSLCSVSLVYSFFVMILYSGVPLMECYEEGVLLAMTADLTKSPSHASHSVPFDLKAFNLVQTAQRTSTSSFDAENPHP